MLCTCRPVHSRHPLSPPLPSPLIDMLPPPARACVTSAPMWVHTRFCRNRRSNPNSFGVCSVFIFSRLRRLVFRKTPRKARRVGSGVSPRRRLRGLLRVGLAGTPHGGTIGKQPGNVVILVDTCLVDLLIGNPGRGRRPTSFPQSTICRVPPSHRCYLTLRARARLSQTVHAPSKRMSHAVTSARPSQAAHRHHGDSSSKNDIVDT
jgi:hypothetical protein